MRNLLQKMTLVLALTFFMGAAMAQGFVKGTVVDADNNETLLGASVVVKGTTTGVSTGLSGTFNLEVPAGTQTISVQFIGFTTQEFSVDIKDGQTVDLGVISLKGSQVGLQEVSVFASLAIDRKTPVAISTISSQLIEDKLGSQEFPEILKSTPGVYATKSGGGFGDGRLNLRGFNSENVAVMINGVPVNDMENGRVYWSNWAGLSDVTRTMQVQRGLGASKVAVPSIGGTINILTKTTDAEQGGNVFTSVGGQGYQKYGLTVSTGLSDNGWATTVSASKTKGDGYVDGTEFEGYNYFVNISKNISANQTISLSSFGAKQVHGQRQSRSLISTYRAAESGTRFNPDWGIKNGEVVHVEDNFYFKPQTSLNHFWTISDKSTLSTALYASWGTGGGGGQGGDGTLFGNRLGGFDQPMDIDNIVDVNRANGALGATSWLRASHNDHSWYGLLSTFNTELSENLDFITGIDLRTYTGHHYYEVTDLLGGAYVANNDDINNPNAALHVGDKYNYYNDGNVGWQGLFTQLEFNKDKLSAFISASLSNTSYQRVDYFQYLDSDPLQTSDKYNFMGFGVKGGANLRLTDKHNVFANIGYFEKAAGFDAVFIRYNNTDVNANAANQKIFSIELGYGYRGEKLAANLNVYRTQWNDRTFSRAIPVSPGVYYYANLLGVNALHQGVEFDFTYKPNRKLSAYGMLSIGDWRWSNNLDNVQVYDENQNPIGSPYSLYIKDVKVSDAAQTTAALGFDYRLMSKLNVTVDYNYYANLYAYYDPTSRTTDGIPQPWKVPAYGLVDASARYTFDFGGFDATLIARVNNLFDTEYIADANDGSNYDAATSYVWYGFGRTFNISAKINF